MCMRTRVVDDKSKRRAVEEWDKSGLSAEDFGITRGIRGTTLQRWGRAIRGPLRRKSGEPSKARAVKLVELPTTIAADAADGILVEIELRNGRRVTALGAWTALQIVELAKALEDDR